MRSKSEVNPKHNVSILHWFGRRRSPRCISTLGWLLFVGVFTVACGSSGPGPGTKSNPPPETVVVKDSTPTGAAAFLGPVRLIEVNGATLGFRQAGTGDPLLLLMGRDGTMSLWQYDLVQALVDAGFRVTMYDHRGVGYSTDPQSEPLTMQLMADDAAALISALGLGRPTIVGWSMGGEIALALATRHPGTARALVLSGADAGSPHYIAGDPAAAAVLADPNADPGEFLGLLFPADAPAAFGTFVDSISLYPVSTVSPEAQRRQTESEEAWLQDSSVWDALGTIDIPLVLTNGADDPLTVPENAALVGARVPGAVVEIFDGASHGMLFQAVDRFVELVKTYGRP